MNRSSPRLIPWDHTACQALTAFTEGMAWKLRPPPMLWRKTPRSADAHVGRTSTSPDWRNARMRAKSSSSRSVVWAFRASFCVALSR